MNQCGQSRRGRHHRMLRAVVLLTFHGRTLSLILPDQTTGPASLSRMISLNSSDGMKYRQPKRRRRVSDFELQVQFAFDQDWDLYQKKIHTLHFPPSYKVMKPSRLELLPRTISTSLHLSQCSESAGSGFGEEDDKKNEREEENDSSNGGPKAKANKSNTNTNGESGRPSGVVKGMSTPNNKNSNHSSAKDTKNANSQVKRPQKKNKNKGTPKSKASHDTSTTVETGTGGVIKTSNENTSLKGFKSNTNVSPSTRQQNEVAQYPQKNKKESHATDVDLKKRVVQLETIVANQMTEIQKLQRKIEDLTRASNVFSNVVDVLREAGIQINEEDDVVVIDEDSGGGDVNPSLPAPKSAQRKTINDDMEIFGLAPKSVTDAADAAGASMLSAILAGKHRMLVDVRDAELTRDPKLFVEFIELAILPVAAGLEGLGDEFRNRVKIVFPTVKDLMSYRRSMALAAPEVVSLSTLGFDPVDERDNLIVIIAPSPDDIAGVSAMKKLIARTDKNFVEPDRRITQPVVVMNHHMVPVDMAGFGKFTTVYHLRLLSVQYMTGDASPEYVTKVDPEENSTQGSADMNSDNSSVEMTPQVGSEIQNDVSKSNDSSTTGLDRSEEEDEALEAAMTHAHEIGIHQGVTRAMVIRAYPK
jgi:hypothetical protein